MKIYYEKEEKKLKYIYIYSFFYPHQNLIMQERYGIYVYINAPAIVDVVIIVCLKKVC